MISIPPSGGTEVTTSVVDPIDHAFFTRIQILAQPAVSQIGDHADHLSNTAFAILAITASRVFSSAGELPTKTAITM